MDALVRLSELAREAGDAVLAEQYLARAFEVWIKISPLDDITPDRIDRYGLPPHQQAADVYFGYGYAGRGGWSWYTGAAARMLVAAYKILGLTMKNNDLIIPNSLFAPKGALKVKQLVYKGVKYASAAHDEIFLYASKSEAAYLKNKI